MLPLFLAAGGRDVSANMNAAQFRLSKWRSRMKRFWGNRRLSYSAERSMMLPFTFDVALVTFSQPKPSQRTRDAFVEGKRLNVSPYDQARRTAFDCRNRSEFSRPRFRVL